MDNLKKFQIQLDNIDGQLAALLQKRMGVVAKAAEYKWNNGVRSRKERKEERVVEKAAELACEIELVAYVEGLIEYVEDVGLKYERKVMRDLDRRKREG